MVLGIRPVLTRVVAAGVAALTATLGAVVPAAALVAVLAVVVGALLGTPRPRPPPRGTSRTRLMRSRSTAAISRPEIPHSTSSSWTGEHRRRGAPRVRDAGLGVPPCVVARRRRVQRSGGRRGGPGVRGATRVDVDDRETILAATRELVGGVLDRNGCSPRTSSASSSPRPATSPRSRPRSPPASSACTTWRSSARRRCGSRGRCRASSGCSRTSRPPARATRSSTSTCNGTEVLRADVPAVPATAALP